VGWWLTDTLDFVRAAKKRRKTRLPSPKMSSGQANEAEKNIEIWKVKKLIKRLEAARGNGTSMISLIIREQKCLTLLRAIPRLILTLYSNSPKGPGLSRS
jgi:peptide chain release factor subunit 1